MPEKDKGRRIDDKYDFPEAPQMVVMTEPCANCDPAKASRIAENHATAIVVNLTTVGQLIQVCREMARDMGEAARESSDRQVEINAKLDTILKNQVEEKEAQTKFRTDITGRVEAMEKKFQEMEEARKSWVRVVRDKLTEHALTVILILILTGALVYIARITASGHHDNEAPKAAVGKNGSKEKETYEIEP